MVYSRLSTIDNPWNPFDNFDEWLQYDNLHHYNTCGYVSRVLDMNNANLSGLPDFIAERINESVIDQIINADPLNFYVKVQKEFSDILFDENGSLV